MTPPLEAQVFSKALQEHLSTIGDAVELREDLSPGFGGTPFYFEIFGATETKDYYGSITKNLADLPDASIEALSEVAPRVFGINSSFHYNTDFVNILCRDMAANYQKVADHTIITKPRLDRTINFAAIKAVSDLLFSNLVSSYPS